MSVETPVAKSPFDTTARDLYQQCEMECTRRGRSWWKLCRHGEFQDDLYDVSQFEVGILFVRELFYQYMMLLDPDKR